MDNKEIIAKKIFEITSKLKRLAVNPEVNVDIKPSEMMLLVKMDVMYGEKSIKVTELKKILKLAPSTISTILKSLEENGYIKRKINKDNRREVYVEVTSKGSKLIQMGKEKHYNLIYDYITYLGSDDSLKLIEIMEKTALFFEEKEMKGMKSNNDKIN